MKLEKELNFQKKTFSKDKIKLDQWFYYFCDKFDRFSISCNNFFERFLFSLFQNQMKQSI
jgi:hypothetical protein